jgi:hypothetical protein
MSTQGWQVNDLSYLPFALLQTLFATMYERVAICGGYALFLYERVLGYQLHWNPTDCDVYFIAYSKNEFFGYVESVIERINEAGFELHLTKLRRGRGWAIVDYQVRRKTDTEYFAPLLSFIWNYIGQGTVTRLMSPFDLIMGGYDIDICRVCISNLLPLYICSKDIEINWTVTFKVKSHVQASIETRTMKLCLVHHALDVMGHPGTVDTNLHLTQQRIRKYSARGYVLIGSASPITILWTEQIRQLRKIWLYRGPDLNDDSTSEEESKESEYGYP